MQWFLTNICTPEWNACQDRGRLFMEGVTALAREYPQYADLIAAYHLRWEEMLGGVIAGTQELLLELRSRGTPVYALSNWSTETFPLAKRRYDCLRWFDGILLSGEVRHVKPERRIFDICCERFGLSPDDSLFVDDSEINVEAARELGFHSVRFESAVSLRKTLVDHGLLPSGDDGQ